MKLKLKKLDVDLPTPRYAYEDDAAFDLYVRESVTLAPGEKAIVATGIAMEIPKGYVGLVWDKGSVGIKGGIKTLGGVVDSNYRGEIMIGVVNLSDTEYVFERGNKVAQMIIQKKETVDIELVDELEGTDRGDKKFGSSGV